MKKSLPIKSKSHQQIIKEITAAILKIAADKIAFIILFGSFARGDWVRDSYEEGGVIYEYASDYDILIVTKNKKHSNGHFAISLKNKIKKEITRQHLDRVHSVTLVIEPLDYVNSELEIKQYFFSDIKKEGVLLFDSGEFELSKPRKLSEEERRKIAKQDYEHWFEKAEEFLIDCKNCFERKNYIKAAFELHQTTESLFNCALLVFTGHKPKTHDLEELNKLCSSQNNKFLNIFLKATIDQEKSFELLQAAYIEARYNKHYKISKEQLEYLVERIERLRDLVKKVCEEKI